MKAEVVSEVERLDVLAPGWDRLAVACRRPRSAPAWALAWYRHAMPPAARMRAVVVSDGDTVVGIAPLVVARTRFGFYRYSLAAPMLNGVEPLCWPGRDQEVGAAMGGALAAAHPVPDLVVLGWMAADSALPGAMGKGWPPPHPLLVDEHRFPVPRATIAGHDFDSWMGERSKNFRNSVRSDYRKLVGEGFEHRVATGVSDIVERLPAMQRLYQERRVARSGTGFAFDDTFMRVVSEAVATSETGRVRLSTVERPGEVIAADLIISAGGEASSWLRGFDDAWAHLSPGRANLALCVEDAIKRGDEFFDLGPGEERYKSSFTAEEVVLQGHLLARRGLRPLHSPAQLLPFAARRRAAGMVGRLRGLRRHGPDAS